jgi:hypothetical protein
MIKKQFTVYLKNRPGALAKITRLLAAAKVNIEGISASSSVDIGLAQIVVNSTAVTARILRKARIPFVTQDVALVPLNNKPGALAQVVSRLAKLGININYVYATACDSDSRCYTIISAPDLKRVEAACR